MNRLNHLIFSKFIFHALENRKGIRIHQEDQSTRKPCVHSFFSGKLLWFLLKLLFCCCVGRCRSLSVYSHTPAQRIAFPSDQLWICLPNVMPRWRSFFSNHPSLTSLNLPQIRRFATDEEVLAAEAVGKAKEKERLHQASLICNLFPRPEGYHGFEELPSGDHAILLIPLGICTAFFL